MPEKAAVTDTHPLLFFAAGGKRLGRRASAFFNACERQEAILYVPAVVVWETTLLAKVGRIDLGRSVRAFFEDLFANPAYQPLDLDPEQVYCAAEKRPNEDPFDALVCAAAIQLGLPLVTRDSTITAWGVVQTVW